MAHGSSNPRPAPPLTAKPLPDTVLVPETREGGSPSNTK
jgi:hypothetical protein